MVAKAAEKNVYLGCNLNHYFTPTAERAMQYMNEGEIGEHDLLPAQDGLQRRRGGISRRRRGHPSAAAGPIST